MTALGWLLLAFLCLPPVLAWAAVSRALRAAEGREELRRWAERERDMAEKIEGAMAMIRRAGVTVDQVAVARLRKEIGQGRP